MKINTNLVSIAICSRNRRKHLTELLHSLKTMTTNYRFEIVVVEETDNPCQVEGVKYVPHDVKNYGIAYARNLALANSNGEIIVFIDDDCSIHDDWLDNLLMAFFKNSVIGVQGGVTVPAFTNAIGWAETILGFPGGGVRRVLEAKGKNQKSREISTLNCAFRRRVFDKIGGFDEKLRYGGEDYLFAKEACRHGDCLFVPTAMVSHRARGNFVEIWSWFVRRGQAEINVVQSRKYEKANYKAIIRGSLGIKLLLCVLAIVLTSDFITYLLGLAILFYVIVIYKRYYNIWKSSMAPVATLVILPAIKTTMALASDWGRLKSLISRQFVNISKRTQVHAKRN